MSNINRDIKSAMSKGKVLLGSKKVYKAAKTGELSGIVYAENCPNERKTDIEYYAKVSGLEISAFKGDSTRLGEVCGKPFNVLVLGIKK